MRFTRTLLAAAFVLALSVVPATAADNPGSTHLSEPSVSPRDASTLTTIRFEVTYTNRQGSEADWVRVMIDGAAHEMTPVEGTWKNGMLHRFSAKLAPGTHQIRFMASRRHAIDYGHSSIIGLIIRFNNQRPFPITALGPVNFTCRR